MNYSEQAKGCHFCRGHRWLVYERVTLGRKTGKWFRGCEIRSCEACNPEGKLGIGARIMGPREATELGVIPPSSEIGEYAGKDEEHGIGVWWGRCAAQKEMLCDPQAWKEPK